MLVAALLAATLLFTSCASAPAARDGDDFASRQLQTIEQYTLDNGVPVIIKKNPANRVYSLKLAYAGGVRMITPAEAGIEGVTLALMSRGSESYDFNTIMGMAYTMSSGISSGASGYDYASFDLNTIDKYWDTMFAVYADCIMNPAFDETEFEQLKSEILIGLQDEAQDPYSVAVDHINSVFFAGHPYEADFGGTIESISNLTLDQVRRYHAEKLGADRMVVVAVGNFDSDQLLADLNATIGTIGKTGVKPADLPPVPAKTDLILLPFEQSEGIAYVRANYSIVDVTEPDFVVLQLAYSMLNELLFDIVRTEHGACYSVWSNAHGFDSTYGSLVVYKTDQPESVKLWVDEAIALMASGKSKNITGSEGDIAAIADTLEAYKAKYINGFFSQQQTNAQMAAQLASSHIYFGDHTEYLRLIEKINAITPDDIVRAMNSYVVGAPMTWIVVGPTPMLETVDKAMFMEFTGTVE